MSRRSPSGGTAVAVAPEVEAAVTHGRPVVALETTLLAHGLPRPDNLHVARQLEATVREHGAVPATVAVLGGVPQVGLDGDGLRVVTERADMRKLGVRDLPMALATKADGATTVASTAHLAHLAGVRVFATGGLGGVHRMARQSWDESADLQALARTGVVVVCAGVKSILDVAATLERLETLGVPVIGYGTDTFPGFYLRDSGQPLDWRADSPDEVAGVAKARGALGLGGTALVVANPLAEDEQLDPALHDATLAAGLRAAEQDDVRGKAVTPFLLDWFHRETGGASLQVNVRIVLRNAALAARIAAALSASTAGSGA